MQNQQERGVSTDRRAIVLVIDGCGIGAAPDAAEFGDQNLPVLNLTIVVIQDKICTSLLRER